jgi:hypothetical protein
MAGDPRVRVWCIGSEKTEYYAAHSEEEMRQFYIEMVGKKHAEEDMAAWFQEVPESELDTEFDLGEEGNHVKTTWQKLIQLHETIPAQIKTAFN